MATWARPLRRQLFLAILALLAPIVVAGVWLGFVEYRETIEELTALSDVTARRTATAVERELTGLDRMARNLSSHPAVQHLDASAVDLLRPQRLQRPSLIDLVLVDRDGRLIARAGSTIDIDDRWTELTNQINHKDARIVSTLQVTPSGLVYVSVAYPLHDDAGKVSGALAYYVDPGLLQDAFRESHLPTGSVVALTQIDGRVLARQPDPERYVGRVLDVNFSDTPQPAQQHGGIDGVRRLFGRAMVSGGPWVVTVGIPMSVAFDRAAALWLRALPALAVVLGGWLMVATWFSRRLTTSVAHLEAAAQRIGSGDFGPIEQRSMPTDEFARLQTAFVEMVQRFNETRIALDAQMAEERRMRQEVESL